jgi:hypothetical protein
MSQHARVDSFAMLRQFRAALTNFASIAAVALDEADTDIQRTLLWLREDRHRHWKAIVQTRAEQYTRAKLALKQREVLDRAIAGTRSSCVDEKKALKIAEKRLQEAEHKFRLVGQWSRQLEKEALDYKGTVQGLINAIETEIPNACARLDKIVDSLEAYVALTPPQMPSETSERPERTVLPAVDMPPGTDGPSPAPVNLQEKAKSQRKKSEKEE